MIDDPAHYDQQMEGRRSIAPRPTTIGGSYGTRTRGLLRDRQEFYFE